MKIFKFKDGDSNIEKLFAYAKYRFPKQRKYIEYDPWGQFVYYRKNKTTGIFYYVNANGHLFYNVYKELIAKIDKVIITDFSHRIYSDEKLKKIFDKILKPFIQ